MRSFASDIPSMKMCILCLVGLLLVSCRKKSAPEFFKLEAQYASLTSNLGDEAFDQDEMGAIETGLKAIGDDMLESKRASLLLQKLQAERARISAEKASATAKKVTPTADWSSSSVASAAEPVSSALANDAGTPSRPWGQMDEAVFQKLFGSCMKPDGKEPLANLGDGLAYLVDSRIECQKKYGLNESMQKRYLFFNKKLVGERVSSLTRTVVDGGTTRTLQPTGENTPSKADPNRAPGVFGMPSLNAAGGGAP
jgi:hypothetical protein